MARDALNEKLRRTTEEDTHIANPPPYPDSNSDTGDDTRVRPGREYPGIPRWVKVSGIIFISLVLLFVIMMLTGRGGSHGPGRHTPSGDTPPPSITEHGVQQP